MAILQIKINANVPNRANRKAFEAAFSRDLLEASELAKAALLEHYAAECDKRLEAEDNGSFFKWKYSVWRFLANRFRYPDRRKRTHPEEKKRLNRERQRRFREKRKADQK